MKRVALLVVVAALFLSTAALANTTVTYSTTGTFFVNGVAQGSSLSLSTGGTVIYSPASTTINLQHLSAAPYDWSVAGLGQFTESGTGDVPTTGTGTTFQLQVLQTIPAVGGTVQQVGTVTGTVSVVSGVGSSSLQIVFGNPTFTWDSTTGPVTGNQYSSLGNVASVPPISWGVQNSTTIAYGAGSPGVNPAALNGIAYTYTPEPSSLMLLGVGASGLLGFIRRRRQ